MKTAVKRPVELIGRLWFPLYFLILLALDMAFRYIYFTDQSISLFSLTPLTFSVCWALLLCGLLYALPVAARRLVMLLTLLSLCVLCVAHAVLYNLVGSFFSFADLAYAGVGAKFFSFAYIKVRPLLLACIILAIIGCVVLVIGMPKKPWRVKNIIVGALLIALSTGALFAVDRRLESGTSQELTCENTSVAIADADAYHVLSNTNRALSASGLYQFSFRSIVSALGLDVGSSRQLWAELDEYYAASEKKEHPDNEMTGAFRGKNLIMITMESIDTWMLTEEYMPNLYALKQKGIDFENNYTPLYISAATFCTEFIANTGLIPPSTGIDVSVYETNSFPYSLPNLFTDAGYDANSFHSASPTIYNRGNVHRNLGYAQYHSYVEMGMDNYIMDSQIINGYDSIVSDRPFFSFILTISAHGAYTDDAWIDAALPHMEAARSIIQPEDIPSGCTDTEEYIRAVAQAMETDKFIGELVDKLTADGHMEDTVLLLFSDHYGKYMTNHDFLMELKGAENTDMLCRTPMIIYADGLSPMKVSKVTSSADILPTLANMFSLDTDYAIYAGDDCFGSGGGYVVFTGNNWYDGSIYYSGNYSEPENEYIISRNREISEKMDAVWNTLRSDYFSRLQ